VASRSLIVTPALSNWLAGRRADLFLAQLWQSRSLAEVPALAGNRAFAALARRATEAADKAHRQDEGNLAVAGGLTEYLTRVLNNAVHREAAAAEHGLTVLASAGSAAPCIGLFGALWGIYHALVQIGMSGRNLSPETFTCC
jgi:biopolymer transport protein ExbB